MAAAGRGEGNGEEDPKGVTALHLTPAHRTRPVYGPANRAARRVTRQQSRQTGHQTGASGVWAGSTGPDARNPLMISETF